MGLNELRGGRKVTGLKQSLRAIQNGTAKTVFIAEDTPQSISAEIRAACEGRDVPLVTVASMQELGKACGIDVKASCAALVR